MIKEKLLELVRDGNFWFRDQAIGVLRPEYLSKLASFTSAPGLAVCVVGVRRAGKTFVCKQFLGKTIAEGLRKEQTLYVNFEDPSLRPLLGIELLQDLYETYRHFVNKSAPAVIVLDEVQNVLGWEKWVRSMLEKQEAVRIIITGSSSKLLSRELASLLTGRTLTLPIFPLDFREFLRFRGAEPKKERELMIKRKEILSFLYEYLEYGGFPQVVLTEAPEVRFEILKELFDGIVTKDIAERHRVREVNDLKVLAVLTVANFSSYISVRKLLNIFCSTTRRKISPSTVNRFLGYFEEAFLCFYVPIFSHKIKDQLQYPRKVYSVDVGLANAVTSRFSENLGRLAENVVAVTLLKRCGRENLFYWKSREGHEVDFVVKERTRVKQLIQVCWDPSDERTRKREVRGLAEAMKEFGLRQGLVLTADFDGEEKVGKKRILYRPLWRWLLQDTQFS